MQEKLIFDETDSQLINEIKAYQTEKGLTFQEAVKELCKLGLIKTSTNLTWGTFEKP